MLVGEKPADEWSERPESKYTQDTEPSRRHLLTNSDTDAEIDSLVRAPLKMAIEEQITSEN
jgi:hypothetical protein